MMGTNISGELGLFLILLALVVGLAIAVVALYLAFSMTAFTAVAVVYPGFVLSSLCTAGMVHYVRRQKEKKMLADLSMELSIDIETNDREIDASQETEDEDIKKSRMVNVRLKPVIQKLSEIRDSAKRVKSCHNEEALFLQREFHSALEALRQLHESHTEDCLLQQQLLEQYRDIAADNALMKKLRPKIRPSYKEAHELFSVLEAKIYKAEKLNKKLKSGLLNDSIPVVLEYLIDGNFVDQESFVIKYIENNQSLRDKIKRDLCVRAAIELRDCVHVIGYESKRGIPRISKKLSKLHEESNETILNYLSQGEKFYAGGDTTFCPTPDIKKRRQLYHELKRNMQIVDDSPIITTLEQITHALDTGEPDDALAAQDTLRSLALHESAEKMHKFSSRATQHLSKFCHKKGKHSLLISETKEAYKELSIEMEKLSLSKQILSLTHKIEQFMKSVSDDLGMTESTIQSQDKQRED